MHTKKQYVYRRQFVLGAEHAQYEGWKKITVKNFFLTVHPDLNCTVHTREQHSLVLLGYILDPFHPYRSNEQILASFSKKIFDINDLFDHSRTFGGRWALLYFNDSYQILFHDPGGLRQVYYTLRGGIWCGSQPEILCDTIGERNIHKNAYKDLAENGAFAPWKNYFWPGHETLYKDIYRLLPNHYLDLQTGKSLRYWPNATVRKYSLDHGAAKIKNLLTNLLLAGNERYTLHQSITSGWDSRLILAASKELFSDINYYTYKRAHLSRFSPDIAIPHKMIKSLGGRHTVITPPKKMSPWFADIFTSNTTLSHPSIGKDAEALLTDKMNNSHDFVTINGNISEVARCQYFKHDQDEEDISADKLASLVLLGGSRYAIAQFSAWLAEVLPVAREYNYRLLDLFHMEQKIGGWLASLRTEFDIVEEVFTPYNCRLFLEYMFAIPKQYRLKTKNTLYAKMIEDLWPELLRYPINPKDHLLELSIKRQFLKNWVLQNAVRPLAVKTGVYQLYISRKK